MAPRKPFADRFGAAPESLIVDMNDLFRKKKGEFREFYNNNRNNLENTMNSFHNIISLLTSTSGVTRPKILSRIKLFDECVRKFEIKYRNKAEESREYNIQDYITDLVGIRVICLYEDDIVRVSDIIKEHFDVISVTDKTKTLVEDYEKFGYKGLHLDIKLRDDRKCLPEYMAFSEQCVEVQIRSIVQDAWSEIDHRLKYKKSIPDTLKRRIVRMAALFDLADQEFTEIRKNTELLESLLEIDLSKEGEKERDSLLTGERNIDSFSFISVMKKHFSQYNFDNDADSESARKIDGFVLEVRDMNPWLTDKEFHDIMELNLPKIQRYVRIITENYSRRMNPFTVTRHVLFYHDREKYRDCLYPLQRKTFSEWIDTKQNE